MQNEIVGVLDEDHVRLGELAAGLRACHRPAYALRQFDEFAQLLGGHLLVMKRIVYPALKTIGWKDVSSVLLLGHARLSRSFAGASFASRTTSNVYFTSFDVNGWPSCHLTFFFRKKTRFR